MQKPIRQGDVLLIPEYKDIQGHSLNHLTLAVGELTGHSHRISRGQAQLVETQEQRFLKVNSATATLMHEEHTAIEIPQGIWLVKIQRQYVPIQREHDSLNESQWANVDE